METYWERDRVALDPLSTLRKVTPTSPEEHDVLFNPHSVNDRLFEILGSSTNRAPLRLVDSSTNNFKGRCFKTIYDAKTNRRTGITDLVQERIQRGHMGHLISTAGRLDTHTEFLGNLRNVLSAWRYLHHDEVLPRVQETRRALRNEITLVENWTRQNAPQNSLAGFTAIFNAFDSDYWEEAADHSRTWIQDWVNRARNALQEFQSTNGQDHPDRVWIEQQLQEIWIETLRDIRAPPPI